MGGKFTRRKKLCLGLSHSVARDTLNYSPVVQIARNALVAESINRQYALTHESVDCVRAEGVGAAYLSAMYTRVSESACIIPSACISVCLSVCLCMHMSD